MENEEIERLAMAELLQEAKQGEERAKELGPAGWLPPVIPPTNKRFLANTLRSTLTSTRKDRGDSRERHRESHRHESSSHRHSDRDRKQSSSSSSRRHSSSSHRSHKDKKSKHKSSKKDDDKDDRKRKEVTQTGTLQSNDTDKSLADITTVKDQKDDGVTSNDKVQKSDTLTETDSMTNEDTTAADTVTSEISDEKTADVTDKDRFPEPSAINHMASGINTTQGISKNEAIEIQEENQAATRSQDVTTVGRKRQQESDASQGSKVAKYDENISEGTCQDTSKLDNNHVKTYNTVKDNDIRKVDIQTNMVVKETCDEDKKAYDSTNTAVKQESQECHNKVDTPTKHDSSKENPVISVDCSVKQGNGKETVDIVTYTVKTNGSKSSMEVGDTNVDSVIEHDKSKNTNDITCESGDVVKQDDSNEAAKKQNKSGKKKKKKSKKHKHKSKTSKHKR